MSIEQLRTLFPDCGRLRKLLTNNFGLPQDHKHRCDRLGRRIIGGVLNVLKEELSKEWQSSVSPLAKWLH
jgi:hypothetical protein